MLIHVTLVIQLFDKEGEGASQSPSVDTEVLC